MQRIVCAANRSPCGIIVCGPRHWDTVMRQQIQLIGEEKFTRAEQGFVDQFGTFLTREEAFVVAQAAGQILRRCGGDEGRLYSENLY